MWKPEFTTPKANTIVYGSGKAQYNRRHTQKFAMLLVDADGRYKDEVVKLDNVRVRWKTPKPYSEFVPAFDSSLYPRHETGGFPMLRVDALGAYKDEIVME